MRVHLRVGEHGRQRRSVRGGGGAAEHVDRIGDARFGGKEAASVARVSSVSSGRTSPAASQASAQRIPSPPALVSTATRRPFGSG